VQYDLREISRVATHRLIPKEDVIYRH